MKKEYSKNDVLRELFFGADTPMEALPITNEDYLSAWRRIEYIENELEKENNKYINELLCCFSTIEDERAFSAFTQGIEVGKTLYSK